MLPTQGNDKCLGLCIHVHACKINPYLIVTHFMHILKYSVVHKYVPSLSTIYKLNL